MAWTAGVNSISQGGWPQRLLKFEKDMEEIPAGRFQRTEVIPSS